MELTQKTLLLSDQNVARPEVAVSITINKELPIYFGRKPGRMESHSPGMGSNESMQLLFSHVVSIQHEVSGKLGITSISQMEDGGGNSCKPSRSAKPWHKKSLLQPSA